MDKITNFKLKDFYKQDKDLVQEYVNYLSYLKPIETRREVFYLSLRQVQQIRDLMQEGTLDSLKEVIQIVQEYKDSEIEEIRLNKFFGLASSIKEQIDKIQHAEKSSLTGTAYNSKWEAVNGSERLAKFGIYNILDTLAGGDILKYEQILDITYADVFTKLYRDTTLSDLDYEMSKIKTINP